MNVKKVLCIEDSMVKYMDVFRYLGRQGISNVDWVTNAEDALKRMEESRLQNDPYDLVMSDMHFDFFGSDDHEAGEKTLALMRKKGHDIPVIFCSSQNWRVPGSIGIIFYNPNRDWESEADDLFAFLRSM